MRYYQLTQPTDAKFCQELAERINRDYPGQAIIEKSSLFHIVKITEDYWKFCRDYVMKHCRTRGER